MSANFSAEGAARIPCAQLSTGDAQDGLFSLREHPIPAFRKLTTKAPGLLCQAGGFGCCTLRDGFLFYGWVSTSGSPGL